MLHYTLYVCFLTACNLANLTPVQKGKHCSPLTLKDVTVQLQLSKERDTQVHHNLSSWTPELNRSLQVIANINQLHCKMPEEMHQSSHT